MFRSVLPRAFRTVWLGQTASLFGSSLSSFALGVWVFQTTGSAIDFGLVILLRSIPYLLVAPAAGVWIDRLNRRTVMLVADVAAALNILAVLALLMAGRLEVWHIYAVVSVASLVFAFQQNAYSAAVAQLVKPDDRGRANGMVQMSQAFAGVLVPMIAGILYWAYGLKAIIALDLISFVVAVGSLLKVDIADPDRSDDERNSVSAELREGWSAFEARPELFSLITLFAATNLAVGFLQVLFTPMVLTVYSSFQLGLVMTCGGLGMLAGGISMGLSGGPKRRATALGPLLAMAGASIAAAGLAPSAWLWAATGFAFFFCQTWIEASAQTLYQNHVPEKLHGKVFSLHRMVGQSTVPIGYLLSPVLAEKYFEPLMVESGALADSVGRILGTGAGRGMGLMFLLVGLAIVGVAVRAMFNRRLRALDADTENDPLAESTVRPLGIGEGFFAAHAPPPDRSPAMTSCVLVRLAGQPPAAATVRRAAAFVLAKYEILSLGIAPRAGEPGFRFVRSPATPEERLDLTFEHHRFEDGSADTDLEALFEREVNHGVQDFDRVLARMIYVENDEAREDGWRAALIGNIHHTAADAVSGFALLDEILKLCREIEGGTLDGPELERRAAAQAVPLPPPIERCFGTSFGFRDVFPLALGTAWQMLRQGPPMVLPPDMPKIPVAQRSTQITVRDLDSETFAGLKRRTRRHKVTVHGAVTSAAAQALAVVLDRRRVLTVSEEPEAKKPSKPTIPLAVSHAVDLRPYTRGEQRLERGALAFAAGSVQCRLEVEAHEPDGWLDRLWRDARRSCLDVRREIKERRAHLLGFSLVRRPIDVYKTADGPRLGRTSSLGISDLGRYPYALDHGSFRIDEILAGGATHIAGGMLNLMVLAVGGKLRLVFLGAKPILSDAELSWLADATADGLEAAAHGDRDLAEVLAEPPPPAPEAMPVRENPEPADEPQPSPAPAARSSGRGQLLGSIARDIGFAFRATRRRLSVTALAVGSLALAVAGNAIVFSMINAILYRPLPYEEPHRLALLGERAVDQPRGRLVPGSAANFFDWRERQQVFTDLAAFRAVTLGWQAGDEEPEALSAAQVSPAFFPVLGVQAARGRLFQDAEAGRDQVVLLAYDFWVERFGARPEAIGESMALGGTPHDVVGVLPEDFDFLNPNLEIYVPFAPERESLKRHERDTLAVGRLADGVSNDQAQTRMTALMDRLAAEYPDANRGFTVDVLNLREEIPGPQNRLFFRLLQVAMIFILLIACANIANLLLARGRERQREIAIRSSLGAGGWRILRQLLTENLAMAALAGLLGLLLAQAALMILTPRLLPLIPKFYTPVIDGRVLLYHFGVTLLGGVLFGLVPVFQSLRTDLVTSLKASATSGGAPRQWAAKALVVAEIAFAMVFLGGAALMLRSFDQLQNSDPGFATRGLWMAQVTLPAARYTNDAERLQAFERLRDEIAGMPGAASLALSNSPPRRPTAVPEVFFLDADGAPADQPAPRALWQSTDPDYFRTLGVELRQGRTFTAADRTDVTPVAVVNETLARRFWSDGRAVGERITFRGTSRQIVGVVADVRHGLAINDQTSPAIYLPWAQQPTPSGVLLLRAEGGALLAQPLRQQLRRFDPALRIEQLSTLDDFVAEFWRGQEVFAVVLRVFGALALFLAAIGIYGVLTYSVSQRSREIGVRMALGADRGRVARMVTGQGGLLAVLGIGLGVVGTTWVSKALTALVRDTVPIEPATTLWVAAGLLTIAFVACWLPAWRAARIHPVEALRGDS